MSKLIELAPGWPGIVARNPFHVKRPGAAHWKGTIGYDARGHAIFSHEVYSVRACTRDLAGDYLDDGRRTLAALFAAYAPASDPNAANDPAGYAAFVGERVGIEPARPLPELFNRRGAIVDPILLAEIQRAMLEFEICRGYRLADGLLAAGHALYTRDFVK